MSSHGPHRCEPAAFKLFAHQVERLEVPDALLTAAVAIAKHELRQVEPAVVAAQLDAWADQVRRRVHSLDTRALLAHGHAVLFDEIGLIGNRRDYYNPLNSYLPIVMETKRGIPITLALVYREVMRRLGVMVEGVNVPGHFLAAVRDPVSEEWTYVDSFQGGRMVSHEEAFALVEAATGLSVPADEAMLTIATPVQWLTRMLANLREVFRRRRRDSDAAAMDEMAALLPRAA